MVLLSNETLEATNKNETGDLPSNVDAPNIFLSKTDLLNFEEKIPETNQVLNPKSEERNKKTIPKEDVFKLNQLCMTLWDEEGQVSWSIGYYISTNNNGTCIIEQLERVKASSDIYWVHPIDEYSTETLHESDIFPVVPIGEWETNKTGLLQFKLKNGPAIRKFFNRYLDEKI